MGATATTDRFGTANMAMSFDGVGNLIDFGSVQTYANTGAAFSFVAWFYLNDFNPNVYPKIATLKSNSSGPFEITVSNSTNYLGVLIGSGSTWGRFKTDTAANLMIASWRQVVIVYNGSGASTITNFKVYLDGVSQSLSAASGFSVLTNATSVGKPTGGGSSNSWEGKVDEVKIFNRALTAAEILSMYNHEKGKFSVGKDGTMRALQFVEDPTLPVQMRSKKQSLTVKGQLIEQ